MNLALKALRNKWRFQTSKGNLNLEQLFELSETELHHLYLSLQSNIQKSKGLLGKKGNGIIEEKLKLIESVFDFLQKEKTEKEKLVENKVLKEKVLEAISEKEVGELKEKSIKELKKMAKKLSVIKPL